jgi:hypothetical protein
VISSVGRPLGVPSYSQFHSIAANRVSTGTVAIAPDIENVRTLLQEDLAITVFERWAQGAIQRANQQPNS